MFKSKFTGTKRTIARFIIAIFFMMVCAAQIISGCRMIEANNTITTFSTYEDYDNFKPGQIVTGVIKDYAFSLTENVDENQGGGYVNPSVESSNGSLILYFAKSSTGKIMLFRARVDSPMSESMSKLHKKEIDEVYYKGVVKTMTASYSQTLRQKLFLKQFKKDIDIKMSEKENFLELMIDMSPTNAGYSQKAIIATFVGAGLVFLAAILVMLKPIKDAYISVLSEKGGYLNKPVVEKDDLVFELQGFYEGEEQKNDDFFVNTDYNIRDYGVNKDNDSPADKSQLPTSKDDPAMNRGENGEALFYTGEVNEEGNFYVSSKREATTEFGKETLNKRY